MADILATAAMHQRSRMENQLVLSKGLSTLWRETIIEFRPGSSPSCFNANYLRLVGLVILRPCQHDNGYTDDHAQPRFKSTLTNGLGFTLPGVPWWSPIQVIADIDLPQLQ